MDRFSLIAGAVLAVAASSASAFVSPAPPPGFGGAPGSWTFTPPSAAQQIGGIMRGPGPSIAGATASGAFRVGAGAARALAGGAARALIPGIGLPLALAWLASNCFEKQNGQWVRTCFADAVRSDGYEYSLNNAPPWSSDPVGLCNQAYPTWLAGNAGYRLENISFWAAGIGCKGVLVRKSDNVIVNNDYAWRNLSRKGSTTCPIGWYVTPAGCVATPQPQPVTVEQIEEDMAAKPLPSQLPPGFPYPLDPTAPFIFNPDTANPPNTQPLRVPQGNPVPTPNTNPQQYKQPVTRFTSAPTPADPFRLDARPEDIVSNSPTGMTGPEPVTSGSPEGKPPEKSDLCAEHPDILACQKVKFEQLDPVSIPQGSRNLAITPDAGWGPSVAGCPADRVANVSFGGVTFSYQPFCQFAAGIRPVVIAVAWLLAAGAFFGFARKD